jgi:hypothetical protein
MMALRAVILCLVDSQHGNCSIGQAGGAPHGSLAKAPDVVSRLRTAAAGSRISASSHIHNHSTASSTSRKQNLLAARFARTTVC